MRSRRAPNERWSAKSSVTFHDGSGEALDRENAHRAVKAIVRWRVDGTHRKAILRSPGLEAKVDDLQQLLMWAYRRNSPPDERGRPQPSKLLPATVPEATHPAEGNEPAASAEPKSLPRAESADGPDGDQELLASGYAIARALAVLDERRTSVTQTGDIDEALAAADEVRKRLAVLAESETSLKSIAKNTSAESKRIGNLTREALAQLELLADQVGKLPKAA